MNGQSLIETNEYLKNKKLYDKMLFVNVASSSAIEMGTLNRFLIKALKNKRAPRFIFSLSDKRK